MRTIEEVAKDLDDEYTPHIGVSREKLRAYAREIVKRYQDEICKHDIENPESEKGRAWSGAISAAIVAGDSVREEIER